METEEACFPFLPKVPAIKPGMSGLIFGGEDESHGEAIALIGISAALSDKAVAEIQALPPIRQVVQFTL